MRVIGAGVVVLAAGVARGQGTYVETFENGVNAGEWTIVGGPGGSIQAAGGNPGAYFGGVNFNYPDVQSRASGAFTGDYRARVVSSLGADFITFSHQGAIFRMSLMLVSDAGTPGDPGDDWGAVFTGTTNVPNTGEGWRPISFAVPSLSPTLPAGWAMIDIGGNPPPQRDWPTLLGGVSQVRFLFAPPGTISNFPVWNIGVDNISIVAAGCYANCDNSTTAPALNVQDFACFLNQFAGGEPYANCDGSTPPPVLNVADFACFLNAFAAGCTGL